MPSSSAANTMLVCSSHAPLLYHFHRPPLAHEQVEQAFATRRDAVHAFDPELVFAFGADHYTSLFRQLAPPFTIASACEAVGDIGGHAGRLNVPADIAVACVRALAQDGIDVAMSHDFKIDHGISQTLHRIAGSVDGVPTIPVVINTMTTPLPPFHRSRKLGEAIGRFAKSLNKRVLFIGSGGLSHNPKVIYPDFGTAEAGVTAWQKNGPANTVMSSRDWYGRLDSIHHDAAELLASGKITETDCAFNRDFDDEVLRILGSGQFDAMDDFDNEALIASAGIGSVEVHSWLAASAANVAAGGELPRLDVYTQALEYGVAFGMVHA